MYKTKNMKKTTGMLCVGILMMSMAGCGTASAKEMDAPQVTTMAFSQGNPGTADTEGTDAEFVDMGKEALKNYFGVDLADGAGYEISVQHMQALPEYNVEAQVAVTFLPEELNLGEISSDTKIDMEHIVTKPMYDVQFTEEGTIKGIHLSYTDWEKSEQPVTTDMAKEAAKEFLVSHQLAESGSLNFLGSAATSADTIAVVFQHKDGRAMLVGVDSLAGKVRFFEDMTKEGAVKSIEPMEEGKGLG